MATKKGAKSGAKKSSKGGGSAKKSSGKSTAKKGSAKKDAARKAGTKKGGSSKKGCSKFAALTAAAGESTCTLTPTSTTILVLNCAPQAVDIGFTLLQAGLISPNERRAFGDCVFQAVLDAGCQINRSDIPTGPNNTLRDVVFAVLDSI